MSVFFIFKGINLLFMSKEEQKFRRDERKTIYLEKNNVHPLQYTIVCLKFDDE